MEDNETQKTQKEKRERMRERERQTDRQTDRHRIRETERVRIARNMQRGDVSLEELMCGRSLMEERAGDETRIMRQRKRERWRSRR